MYYICTIKLKLYETKNLLQCFVSMLVNSQFEEIQIITTSVDIIYDMVAVCARVLTEFDTIIDCPTQTFAANQHDIIHTVLNNKNHQLSDLARGNAVKQIQGILDKVTNATSITKAEAEEYAKVVKLVGEPLIRNSVMDQIYDKLIK